MLRSMTGFGRATSAAGHTEATVEVRAVNGRFAEVTVRAPRALAAFEPAIQAGVKEALGRGNVTVSVTLQRRADEAPLAVDRAAAARYARLLRELRDAAGLLADEAPLTLDHLLRYPEVLTATPAGADDDEERSEAWAAAEPALSEALQHLDAMRLQEGRALADDLAHRLDLIETALAAIEARAPVRVDEARARLRDRLEEVLGDERLNRDRLETEIAILADKLDVAEECVRLHSHLIQFREALVAPEAVGRRLNFLSQEVNREVNTIGSKANDSEIARLAVTMKEELERIREQVQNVV
ncbi:MAG TPA: YicC/YloC family endoribonuclease [Rhodothermales bacterium]|nr:YicC/YloC family endoribonuclease [Rhodothermales bacterium]